MNHSSTVALSAADRNCAVPTRRVHSHEISVGLAAFGCSVCVHALALNKKNARERGELQGGFRGGC